MVNRNSSGFAIWHYLSAFSTLFFFFGNS